MILVTGASGYLGSHITQRLVKDGYSVRAMVRNKHTAQTEGRLAGLEIDWVEADVTQPATLINALEGITTVVHTVAIAIEKSNLTYEKINYQGTVNVVDAAKAAGVRRFINICQLGADSNLPYRFLASKGKAQEYVAGSGLDWTAFRPSTIWGPEDEFANSFAKLIPLTPIIFPIIGDENSLFQPVWVEDVVTSVVSSIDDLTTISEEYELGGPEILTLEEIERRTISALGTSRVMVKFPMPLIRIVVTGMEFLPSPPVTRSLLELLQVSNVTTKNAINRFVDNPRPFTSDNAAEYMQDFQVRSTLAQFFGK